MRKIGRKLYVDWSWFVLGLERVYLSPAKFNLTPKCPALLYEIMDLGETRTYVPIGPPAATVVGKASINEMISWREEVWMTPEEAKVGEVSQAEGSHGRRIQYVMKPPEPGQQSVIVAVEKIMEPAESLGFTAEFDHPAQLKTIFLNEDGGLMERYVGRPVSDISTLNPDEIINDREAWVTQDEAVRHDRKP